MAEQKKEYIFDFGVWPLSEEQAEDLFAKIVILVEEMGVNLGGSYHSHSAEGGCLQVAPYVEIEAP